MEETAVAEKSREPPPLAAYALTESEKLRLAKLLGILEGDLMRQCEQARKRSRLGPIKDLAHALTRLAGDFKAPALDKYVPKLNLSVASFDVDHMLFALSAFLRMVSFLRFTVESS